MRGIERLYDLLYGAEREKPTEGRLTRLYDVLTSLTDREELIIKLRFGLLDGGVGLTLKAIGKIIENKNHFGLPLSPERIRQMEKKAIRRLRHPSRRQVVLRGN